jgi:hypothetical protein
MTRYSSLVLATLVALVTIPETVTAFSSLNGKPFHRSSHLVREAIIILDYVTSFLHLTYKMVSSLLP